MVAVQQWPSTLPSCLKYHLLSFLNSSFISFITLELSTLYCIIYANLMPINYTMSENNQAKVSVQFFN